MPLNRIGILGAGNMGSALACLLAKNGHRVVLWDHFSEVVHEINSAQRNSRYLPGIELPANISAVESAGECVDQAPFVIVAVPSPFVQPLLENIRTTIPPEAVLINAAKGLDRGTRRPIHETIHDLLPANPLVLLAGPAIANEFVHGRPTAVVLASDSRKAAEETAECLRNEFFRAQISNDVTGAALGGILKNIYALLLGFVETGISAGRNFEAAVLTASIAEMIRMGEAFGGRRETVLGLAGLGDLAATGFSADSHNRKCGRLLGSGMSLQEVETEMKLLPEGARTAGIICDWAREKNLAAPLAGLVRELLLGNTPAPGKLLDAVEVMV